MPDQEKKPFPPQEKPNRGNSDQFTRRYLDSLLIEMRLVDSHLADTKMQFLGAEFDTPIMFGVIGSYECFEGSLIAEAQAAAQTNTALWISSHVSAEDVKACVETGAKVIQVIKPYVDLDEFLAAAKEAEELGVFAVATDIDHAYSKDGKLDQQGPHTFGPRSFDDLKKIVESIKVPFIVKGVLSVADAVKCKEAGVAAILVSHHHSIMDWAVPPLMILGDIRKAMGEDYPIIVDCGINTGADAFKALALGADGVCSARAIMKCMSQGKDAFVSFVEETTGELRHFLSRTGSPDIRHIDPAVIHQISV